jgi:hypothetical protein
MTFLPDASPLHRLHDVGAACKLIAKHRARPLHRIRQGRRRSQYVDVRLLLAPAATGNVTARRCGLMQSCWAVWPRPIVSTGAELASTPQRAGKKGGEGLGPNPTDRDKPGTTHHLIVDAGGVPLAVRTSPANLHDSKLFESMIDAIPATGHGRAGRPRRRPGKVHADKGHDNARRLAACAARRIKLSIASMGVESKTRLGQDR